MALASALRGAPSGHQPQREPVRVLVVDDSMTARTVLSRLIEREDGLELAGQARNAEDALAQVEFLAVDVILLDLDMPGMGGLHALPRLIEKTGGAQILVVSSLTQEGAEPTVQALALGAADTFPKPQSGRFDQDYRDVLVSKIRALGAGVPTRPAPIVRRPDLPLLRKPSRLKAEVLAIGASTGGIHALGQFFEALPRQINIPILVTQHLPGSFMEAFARQLEIASGRKAEIAQNGSVLEPDKILIAPGDAHIAVTKRGDQHVIRFDRSTAPSGCMPSVDPMFDSLAEVFGAHALCVVLSGMGRDGTEGARRVAAAGGTILAQDEGSCAVWGMPGSVALAGLASSVLPPLEIASRVAASARAH